MTKQTINIGTSVNSKDGDPLRSAFDKVNVNFTELYTRVLGTLAASVPVTSKGASGDTAGMIVANSGYLYVCTATWTTGDDDIWSRTAVTATTW